jgi:hypothetical protein
MNRQVKLTATKVSYDPLSAQKSYNLGLLMWCVRNFSAIFHVDPSKTPGDRARTVGGFPGKK